MVNSQEATAAGTGKGAVWQQDLLASLVVFLVALPLCMGIALASGAPIAAGLVTGIVGGLVVGTFAGSPLQVSGPAAGLTVLCADVIRQHGMASFGIVVLIAGVFQLLAGILRLGQWFRAVSPAVIHGMLSGIGVLILCGQLHVMVDERPKSNTVQSIMALPESLAKGMAMPTLEAQDIRTARIELLRQISDINDRQRTLRGDLFRSLQRTRLKAEPHAEFAFPDEFPTTIPPGDLQGFVTRQNGLTGELHKLVESVKTSALASIVVSGDQTFSSLAVLLENESTEAKNAMETGNIRSIVATQELIAGSIADLSKGLKQNSWAGKIGILALLVIFAWQALARGKLKLIPAPLLAIVITTVITAMFQIPILHVTIPDSLFSGMTFPTMQEFKSAPLGQLLVSAGIIAIVASAETLLCATAVDQMHRGPRTRYDRELSAQGLGNLICGCLGVLPMTGVIVRSAANVQAGGKTRLSAILHGVWLLLFSVALVPLLRMIPTAALAGILVFTGLRLIDWKGFLHLWKENRLEAAIFLTTMLVIIAHDLLMGVVVGMVLSSLKLLARFSQLDVAIQGGPDADGVGITLKLVGAATFLRLPRLANRLEKIPAGEELEIDVTELHYIDRACMELLQNWSRQHTATGGKLTIDWEALDSCFQPHRKKAATA